MTHGRDDIKQLTLTKTAEMRRRDFLAGVATTITLVSTAPWAIPRRSGK
jgi:hypothetical protein